MRVLGGFGRRLGRPKQWQAPGDPSPIGRQSRSLEADPEELRRPRRQVEGGYVAGHVEQLQAEERHDVPNDDYDQEPLRGDPQGRTCRDLAVSAVAIQWRSHLSTLPWAGIFRRSRDGSPGSPRNSDAPPITRSTRLRRLCASAGVVRGEGG